MNINAATSKPPTNDAPAARGAPAIAARVSAKGKRKSATQNGKCAKHAQASHTAPLPMASQ